MLYCFKWKFLLKFCCKIPGTLNCFIHDRIISGVVSVFMIAFLHRIPHENTTEPIVETDLPVPMTQTAV